MDNRAVAEQIFRAGIEGVMPQNLIMKTVELRGDDLRMGALHLDLIQTRNIYVIGAGKASARMGLEIEKVLGSRITAGHIVVKYGHACSLKRIVVTEAGHPVPDSNGFRATSKILEIAEMAGDGDLVICLLSGGGSALLADYPDGSSPNDLISVNNTLINCGATISEVNAVRKHLSSVKGGRLARAVYPATLVSLIISDVPGDSPDVIASGPTVPDTTTYRQALEVVSGYGIMNSVPDSILVHLRKGAAGGIAETPKPGDPVFDKVTNLIIGTNRIALENSRMKALEYNINAVIVEDELQGDVGSVSRYLVDTAVAFLNNPDEVKPVCLLFGGETTVKMTGKGKGGRNQHLALMCAMLLKDQPGITVLCAGTDGTDGPTDATGAVVDSETVSAAIAGRMDPAVYISEFDSYRFFRKTGGHIITGPTMTNVMDIIVILISVENINSNH